MAPRIAGRPAAARAGAGARPGAFWAMAHEAPPCVEVMEHGDGRLLYRVAMPPATMPPVPVHALEGALDAARAAALGEGDERRRSFRFLGPDGHVADFDIEDRDARIWAAAVDRRADLATLGGLALCLRLLALVHLLATAPWARRYVSRDQGARIDRRLLRAAARADLTDTARFDEVSFRRNIPSSAAGRAAGTAFTGASL